MTVKLFVSNRIIVEENLLSGGVLVGRDGKILAVLSEEGCKIYQDSDQIQIINVGNNVLMPGIIDTHVHVNEPGRTDWEGFETATKAAASGGVTTIIDMPLNSIPPTTSVKNFQEKITHAKGKVWVDVGFWGGLIPDNKDDLIALVKAGVVGFKCFMCHSGVEEFPKVSIAQIAEALEILEDTDSVLAFHAEVDEDMNIPSEDPTKYHGFLSTRPATMECAAISEICRLSTKFNVKMHIVHLSAAEALPLIAKAKQNGAKLTVETCHHYLTFKAEEIRDGATEFKCCPPIRDAENQKMLWRGLQERLIDMVVSDHSPCTPDLKCTDSGNFLQAWGGISSVQFGLPLFWTNLKQRNMKIVDIPRYLTQSTAKLVGLHKVKGKIALNYDADFVIWDPEESITIEEALIEHKNKLTPYLDMKLFGKVLQTVVRGEIVYENGKAFSEPRGKLLIK